MHELYSKSIFWTDDQEKNSLISGERKYVHKAERELGMHD